MAGFQMVYHLNTGQLKRLVFGCFRFVDDRYSDRDCIMNFLVYYFADSFVRSIAVCAGSGSSVLNGVKADLLITGEMSHHEVLVSFSLCHIHSFCRSILVYLE